MIFGGVDVLPVVEAVVIRCVCRLRRVADDIGEWELGTVFEQLLGLLFLLVMMVNSVLFLLFIGHSAVVVLSVAQVLEKSPGLVESVEGDPRCQAQLVKTDPTLAFQKLSNRMPRLAKLLLL